ncbi:MAG: pyridoxamine 5'-phosphate oxidase [Gammaproteobacteria bacterium]|nr:pyridoxamine 5'-phosphate oxidase [Gammaproteobacteria bacterium]
MTDSQDQRDKRREYGSKPLRRINLFENPFEQFGQWLEDAEAAGAIDATAMTLATVDSQGMPSARTVLMKHFDEQGFCWYTHYLSQKGMELAENTKACLLFYWRDISRQVSIRGTVTKLPDSDSDHYFQSRPEGSRFSAAGSRQSSEVSSRGVLETAVDTLRKKHPSGDVPRPKNWGGYCLSPISLEFWQGRDDRLHDRFRYQLESSGHWVINRLAP